MTPSFNDKLIRSRERIYFATTSLTKVKSSTKYEINRGDTYRDTVQKKSKKLSLIEINQNLSKTY